MTQHKGSNFFVNSYFLAYLCNRNKKNVQNLDFIICKLKIIFI